MSGQRRGTNRELAIRSRLRDEGWLAFRAPASLGVADVIALKRGERSRLIEVKSTSNGGPFNHFGPADRNRLSAAAALAGADAFLVHWPPNKPCVWIPESEWPT